MICHQVDDGDGGADDAAQRSGSQDEPEAPAELEGEDHVFQVDQQRALRNHQVVELKEKKCYSNIDHVFYILGTDGKGIEA
jgi:hypothetical protein